MNLEQATEGRRITGKAASWLFLLFFLAILDGLISQARYPLNRFDVLPGASEKFNFTLREPVQGQEVERLSYACDTKQIRVSFESIHKGFFLGGEMCRGDILVSSDITPGDYRLKIGLKETLPQKSLAEFYIKVHPNQASIRQHSTSIIRKNVGISPWQVAALSAILMGMSLGMVYFFSHNRERLLIISGKADIYRIKKMDDCREIAFGMGYAHGLQPGMRVHLLNERYQIAGEAEISQVFEIDSFARIPLTISVIPGYMVSIMP